MIATGFDGRRRPDAQRASSAERATDAAARAPRERDFLEELERQRTETTGGGNGHGEPRRRDEDIASLVRPASAPPLPTAPASKPQAYDADDLEIPSFLRRK